MMKQSKEIDQMWVTLEFDKHTPKDELSGMIKAIKQMGLRCKFRAETSGLSFIEVLCDQSQQRDIDKLVRSKFKIGELNIRDIDANQELFNRAIEERKFTLPEDTHKLSIYSAAMGMKSAFEDFPSLKKPNKLLEKASGLCTLMLGVDPTQADNIKLYRGTFIPSYITGYRVGAQLTIHMDPVFRKETTNEISLLNSQGNGLLTLAKFEKIIEQRMQEINATKVSELFQE